MKRMLVGVTLAIVLPAIPLVAASKNATQASIILNTPTTTASAIGAWEPKLGETVTFTVTYPKTLDHYGVRIQVLCYQNGNLVYGEAGPYDQGFLLGGAMSIWYQNSGAATCHADLYYWSYNGGQKFNPIAYTDFEALGR